MGISSSSETIFWTAFSLTWSVRPRSFRLGISVFFQATYNEFCGFPFENYCSQIEFIVHTGREVFRPRPLPTHRCPYWTPTPTDTTNYSPYSSTDSYSLLGIRWIILVRVFGTIHCKTNMLFAVFSSGLFGLLS